MLAATGFDSGPLILALSLFAIGAGAALLLVRRGRRRSAMVAAAPLLVAALLLSGTSAPAPAFAAPAVCPTATPSASPSPTSSPTTTPADFRPGAAGIGDPYFPLDGNGGYDVEHYALDLSYDPESDVLAGTATITAVATQDLSAFNLDFDTRAVDGTDSIVIGEVTVDDAAAEWSLESTQISVETGQPQAPGSTDGDATPPRTELTVVPEQGIRTGSTITTVVAYSGVPITIDDAFGPAGVFRTPTGAVIVGQPRVAATWFPANDHPADKATFSTRMTVPAGLQVIGNGRLAAQTENGATTTWDWEMEAPMATYLATATVGEYQITEHDEGGIAYYNAIDPTLFTREADGGGAFVGDVATSIFDDEPEVIDFLSGYFGPYPFGQAGGIAIGFTGPDEDLQYALENQTRPIYPAWAFPADADASVVVHELAHQWYGDSVALGRWADIWLNEGFATYAEWLWAESQGGLTPQETFDYYYANADDAFWSTVVADPGAAGIFDGPVYTRGAMALQALRTAVGDEAFFAILKGWASDNAGGSVTTAQFIDYAEQVSGQDLTALFDAWIFTPSKPAV
ncbi:M1 family metallopeptidase [Compostimonas suwonensis]|uniref:Aminopeptidase N n=1 Tax=Compostimonas suwonensis TaxID=1048394 RepID=A0A2M9C3D9_9MICO|nr:M1 family metallopeptidase [Compostimonas suwonensis]PJJ65061.1 peptidase M1-like protein [Compostimonas suwonensis]